MPRNLFAKKSIKRGSYVRKIVHKAIIIVAETKEHLQFFDIGRKSPLLNCLSFLGPGLTVPIEMMYTKYSNSVRPNLHLVGFEKRELGLSLDKTHSMCWRCSEVKNEYIRISYKYTVQKWSRASWKTLFISLWNILGVLLRPSGMTTSSKRPNIL